jgi:hypothetical protein
MDDEETIEEATVIEGCCREHEMRVATADGTKLRLVPARDGEALPLGASGMALVVPGNEPGTVMLKHVASRSGPAKVATKKYRSGWDATFKKQLDRSLN